MQDVSVEGKLPGRDVAPLDSGERAAWSRELIKKIAADIGTDMVAYIEVMYPAVIKATPSTFKISVRNHIYNQVMAAIEITDADQIEAWLKDPEKTSARVAGGISKKSAAAQSIRMGNAMLDKESIRCLRFLAKENAQLEWPCRNATIPWLVERGYAT